MVSAGWDRCHCTTAGTDQHTIKESECWTEARIAQGGTMVLRRNEGKGPKPTHFHDAAQWPWQAGVNLDLASGLLGIRAWVC